MRRKKVLMLFQVKKIPTRRRFQLPLRVKKMRRRMRKIKTL